MKNFAKLFDTKHGQILIVRDTCDENVNPLIKITFQLPALGVCTFAIEYKPCETEFDKRDAHFDLMTDTRVIDLVKAQLEPFGLDIDES